MEFEDGRLKVHSPDAQREARIAKYVETGGILLHIEQWKDHDGSIAGVRMQFPTAVYVDAHAEQKRELWREPPQAEAKIERSSPHAEDAKAGQWIATTYVLLDDRLDVYSQGKEVYSQPLLKAEVIKFQLIARQSTAYFRNVAIMKLRPEQLKEVRAGRLPTFGALKPSDENQDPSDDTQSSGRAVAE